MTAPTVSVIVPAFDAMPDITRCIESVFAQSLPSDRIELIAVDDGSTDGTAEELDRLAAARPQMTVIHQPNSGGPSAPRNRGLEIASGDWVYFLDADDYLAPEALSRMVDYAHLHHSEIVVGRMVGIGTRVAAASMFTHDQPHADVFTSRVYWTLGPLKLFSRELIDREQLRFPEDLHYGDDQPFVAAAYLAARNVSVLSSYDCVFITHRDDRRNITLSGSDLAACLKLGERMLTFVSERVDAGPHRDHLMRRHFEVEVLTTIERIAEEDDLEAAWAACDVVAGWTRLHYTDAIRDATRPYVRLCVELAARGMLAELRDVVAREASPEPVPVELADGRALSAYPHLNDPQAALDDRLFDVTDRLAVRHLLTRADWSGDTLALAGTAAIEGIGPIDADSCVVARHRDSGEEEPLQTTVADDGLFSAMLDFGHAAGGALDPGIWDLYLDARASGITRRARVGSTRAPDLSHEPLHRLVGAGSQASVITTYYTRSFSNLSLDIGYTSHRIEHPLHVDDVTLGPGARLRINGTTVVTPLPSGSVSAVLEAAGVAITRKVTLDGGRLIADVDLRGIHEGRYRVWLQVDAGDLRRREPVRHAASDAARVTWWQGFVPMAARTTKASDGALVVNVRRRQQFSALVRRFRKRARAERP